MNTFLFVQTHILHSYTYLSLISFFPTLFPHFLIRERERVGVRVRKPKSTESVRFLIFLPVAFFLRLQWQSKNRAEENCIILRKGEKESENKSGWVRERAKIFRELYDDDARLEILIFHKNIFYYVICMAG